MRRWDRSKIFEIHVNRAIFIYYICKFQVPSPADEVLATDPPRTADRGHRARRDAEMVQPGRPFAPALRNSRPRLGRGGLVCGPDGVAVEAVSGHGPARTGIRKAPQKLRGR